MRLFLVFALAVAVGGFLGLFAEEEQTSVSSSMVTAGTVTIDRVVSNPVRRVKRLLRPTKDPSYGSFDRARRSEMVAAAQRLAPHTKVPASILVAISEQETGLGSNYGKPGRAVSCSKNIREQIILDVLAGKYGLDSPNALRVSSDAAFGLVQARPSYYLHHTGMEIGFGSAPIILLHGTDEYRKMSHAERVSGMKVIQRKLGLRGSDVDGVIGAKTLDAIQSTIGTRSFGRVAKYRLMKRFFAGEIKVSTSKKRDQVWQRICLAEGKDPRKAKYFMPDLWDPLHALAYASVHIEDDLRLAGGKLDVAIAAYYTGIGSAKEGCKDGLWYRRQVKAKARKYASASAKLSSSTS